MTDGQTEQVPVVTMRERRVIREPRNLASQMQCCGWRRNYKQLARGWKCEVCGRVWNYPPKMRL